VLCHLSHVPTTFLGFWLFVFIGMRMNPGHHVDRKWRGMYARWESERLRDSTSIYIYYINCSTSVSSFALLSPITDPCEG
jgi:hypothetical protein